ncbi:gamma-glutamyltransferase [Platysternon megacephalum]|uniref:Gamma-glutamyltransferase n=1 Tax=Platysternon megacephalum TaxID=55544 RepID=A0A4D9DNT4_9SAUR|nr:gamma-glutamyltransferase [Platysternon megacephalum]
MNQELFETLMESSQVSTDDPANEQEESSATSGMVALRGALFMLGEHLTLIRKRKKRTREDMFCRIFHPLQPSEQGLGGPI